MNDPVAQVKPALETGLADLLTDMMEEDLEAAVFFAGILDSLRNATNEEALLEVFINLSTTAFRGFVFSEAMVARVDVVLEQAEHIAHAFTASADVRH